MSGSQRRKAKNEREKKDSGPLTLLEVTWPLRGRGLQQCGGGTSTMVACLFVCISVLCSDQSTDPQYLGVRILFAHAHLLPQVVCKLPQDHVHSCMPCGQWWGIGSCYCAESWNWWSWLQSTIQAFRWTLRAFNRLQSSKVVTLVRFCQCNCCLGGETDFWSFLLRHLPRIL